MANRHTSIYLSIQNAFELNPLSSIRGAVPRRWLGVEKTEEPLKRQRSVRNLSDIRCSLLILPSKRHLRRTTSSSTFDVRNTSSFAGMVRPLKRWPMFESTWPRSGPILTFMRSRPWWHCWSFQVGPRLLLTRYAQSASRNV